MTLEPQEITIFLET